MSNANNAPASAPAAPTDFIRDIVAEDLRVGKHPRIHTRFPPEPNGYLHIGHAKSICLNFGIAREFGGTCNLRMDDTNPTKEEVEYVESIIADVRWLIDGWADDRLGLKPKGSTPQVQTVNGQPDLHLGPVVPPTNAEPGTRNSEPVEPFYASDYFEPLYEYAVALIQSGKAYVCDLSPEDTEAYRGAPDRPGKDSPFRGRSISENLDLFRRMRQGEFPDGTRTLRAKIDMASPNIWLRDPVLYRIRHAEHHHTGNRWCPLPERLPRGHHAQHLHPGIRGAPPALRLDPREPASAAPAAAPVRVRAPQPLLYRDEQAQASPARQRRARQRLG